MLQVNDYFYNSIIKIFNTNCKGEKNAERMKNE